MSLPNDKQARTKALAAKIRSRDLVVAPGVFDGISLRVADGMGFDCLYMTGYGAVASGLGLPDAGLATFSDMVGTVERLCGLASTP